MIIGDEAAPTIAYAKDLYKQGLLAFRAGDNQRCISLTSKSLEIGYLLADQVIIGQALMGLCRASLRDNDEDLLERLNRKLVVLAEESGDDWWLVVVAHMNAEMARINEDYERANRLYDESMEMSQILGYEGMVATERFNKSLVALACGDLDQALLLLQKHFQIRDKLDEGDLDPYGLIAVVSYLVARSDIENAAETAFVCRRLLGAENIVPDPADEAPLKTSETLIQASFTQETLAQLESRSLLVNCRDLVERHIGAWQL